MQMPEAPDVAKLGAGLLGSLVSLRFVQGTAIERTFMFVGGAAVSYYSTGPLADWIGGRGIEGLVGFFSGSLGMTIVAKVYEIIQMVDAKQVSERFMSWLGGRGQK